MPGRHRYVISEAARRDLRKLVKGRILFDEPMKNHTSFRIGGLANALVVPRDESELRNIVAFAQKKGVPVTVIGNGTKLLVSDRGIDGITIKVSGCLEDVILSGTRIQVGAGCLLRKLCRLVAPRGLAGLEFAIGIPGTVGGAVFMNAGAHQQSIGDLVEKARTMDLRGHVKDYSQNKLRFGYRRSILQCRSEIVMGVELRLHRDDPRSIAKRMDEYLKWRRENQPVGVPSVGSIFKNPGDISAGMLIDKAGFKGMRVGDAEVSVKRANFIVNTGEATANDVFALMSQVREKVWEKYCVKLEPEIRLVGPFGNAWYLH
jgi:UDP-N-acetylmuramate dehydrogenase